MIKRGALVLFSGGLDSTTALYWARKRFSQVQVLVVHYGQSHAIEVTMARHQAMQLEVACHELVLPLRGLLRSALLDDSIAIPDNLAAARAEAAVPVTYVPFRNGILLSLAAACGESNHIYDLVTGFNRIDSPDYPDTTAYFSMRMQAAINAGTGAAKLGKRFRIHTPLAQLSKRQIIELGLQLDADYSHAISCYRGDEMPCGHCPSCDIRDRAFAELGLVDPLRLRLQKEGKP